MNLKDIYKNVMEGKLLYFGGLTYTLTLSTMLGILISDKFDSRFKKPEVIERMDVIVSELNAPIKFTLDNLLETPMDSMTSHARNLRAEKYSLESSFDYQEAKKIYDKNKKFKNEKDNYLVFGVLMGGIFSIYGIIKGTNINKRKKNN